MVVQRLSSSHSQLSSTLARWMAFTNVLIVYAVLKGVSLLLPVSAFRLGFTNGLMSESMILWFGIMLIWERRDAA